MSAARCFHRATRGCQQRLLPRSRPLERRRHFHNGAALLADEPPNTSDSELIEGSAAALAAAERAKEVPDNSILTAEEMFARAIAKTSSNFPSSRNSGKAFQKTLASISADLLDEDKSAARIEQWSRRMLDGQLDLDDFRDPNLERAGKQKQGFLNMGEDPDPALEDPEFEEDDISSLAHADLEQHREFREYARLAAWEMPMLTKMAKPFEPPSKKQVLRFRYTTYMGEQHPAEKKVVVEFCPGDMPDLTEIQQLKLKKLAGVRWNPETDIIKMSCEMFETQAQNKRYLGDLVDTLVREARDPTDTFEDVPLDTRHHPIKVKPKFPVEWRMTGERRALLEAQREQSLLADQSRAEQGTLVDGVQQIQLFQEAMARVRETQTADPLLSPVAAGKEGKAGKGKKRLAVRR